MAVGRTLREAVGGLIAARFALFGLELRDELDRVAVMVGLAMVAAFSLVMALSFFGLTILFGFWAYRIVVCSLVALVFLLLGLAAWWKVKQLMELTADPFPLTSEEFAQDRKLIEAAFTPPESAKEENHG
ncbi:phage holin family protein [Chitinibacter fontanus]|uniref:Phage holin family protein n=1 Tax=Chitinibacter fontanus TaxID=1737446 RepID=A0A7D5VC43_9NEIS|nr:phage holin family protein [Chitinibacter fontanus]QLI82720.1 phage holin family protein [Chitinibacter fontanus]